MKKSTKNKELRATDLVTKDKLEQIKKTMELVEQYPVKKDVFEKEAPSVWQVSQ